MGANVIDIRHVDMNKISKDKVFAIDTNVLLWTHYSKASNPNLRIHPYQVNDYPNFVADLMNNRNKIVTTILNITELYGVVERNEYKIYKAVNGNIKFKDYRAIIAERISYKNEIDTMIMQIEEAYDKQIEIIDLSYEIVNRFRNEITSCRCDVFDYLVIEYLKNKGICNYISDDKDFMSIDGINLYTSYEV